MNSPKWENTFKMKTICKNFLPNGRVLSHLGENLPSWACAPTDIQNKIAKNIGIIFRLSTSTFINRLYA